MIRKTTIREWLESAPEMPTVFFMPETKENEYGLEDWANLPHGSWKMSKVPDSILDKEFSCGYGTQSVPLFMAWSPNYVYYVHECDGSTSLDWVRRHPTMKRVKH